MKTSRLKVEMKRPFRLHIKLNAAVFAVVVRLLVKMNLDDGSEYFLLNLGFQAQE